MSAIGTRQFRRQFRPLCVLLKDESRKYCSQFNQNGVRFREAKKPRCSCDTLLSSQALLPNTTCVSGRGALGGESSTQKCQGIEKEEVQQTEAHTRITQVSCMTRGATTSHARAGLTRGSLGRALCPLVRQSRIATPILSMVISRLSALN